MHALDRSRLLDHPPVLKPPLQGIRYGQVSELGGRGQDLLRQCLRLNVVDRKKALVEERDYIVRVTGILDDAAQPGRSLKIRGAGAIDKDRMKNLQVPGPLAREIGLLVDKHEKEVAETVALLPRGPEWARRLRLLDACYLHIHSKLRKVDPLCR